VELKISVDVVSSVVGTVVLVLDIADEESVEVVSALLVLNSSEVVNKVEVDVGTSVVRIVDVEVLGKKNVIREAIK
jgi:hypothetical protein